MDDFLKNQRLLVISPHADDEEYGCAGTIAKIKDLGGEVYIMVMSVGNLKHYNGTDTVVSKKTRNIVYQNIIVALAIKLVFVGLGVAGVAEMWEAVFADVGVTIIAIFNALRVLR